MGVEMFRVDERMLHGQVVTTFSKVMNIDEYIVVNDEVCKDENERTLLELAVPAGADFDCVSCDTFAKIDADNDYWGNHTFVVFRYIDDALACARKGVKIDKLNVGGMYSRPNRPTEKEYGPALNVDDHDIECFRELEKLGVELIYRVSFYFKEEPLKNKVKY
ncbi:MAG: PTS sugar transporter subunit IIB [Erysipelotrichaceae bacterium]|nr:PTS sugar transporter subunit IIB [Erysipelotrichaceae bacterium]